MENKRIIDELNEERKILITILQNPKIVLNRAEVILDNNLEKFVEKVREFLLNADLTEKSLKYSIVDFRNINYPENVLINQIIEDGISKHIMYNKEIERKIYEKYNGKLMCGPLTPNNFTVIVAEDLKDRLESEGLHVSYLPYSTRNFSLIEIKIEAKLSELPLDLEEIKYELTQYPDENVIKRLEPTKSI